MTTRLSPPFLLRQRRRLTRGAALVESVIVTGMLIAMMAAGLFLHRVYVAQHKALEDARLAAWSQALAGCSSGVDMNAVWRETGASDAPIDVESETTPSFFGMVGHTSGSAAHSAAGSARLGAPSFSFSASDTVACNEVPQNERGDALSLLGFITDNVIPPLF